MVKVIDSTNEVKQEEADYQACLNLVRKMFSSDSFEINTGYDHIGLIDKKEEEKHAKFVISPLFKRINVYDKKYFDKATEIAERFEQDLFKDKGIEYIVRKGWIAD